MNRRLAKANPEKRREYKRARLARLGWRDEDAHAGATATPMSPAGGGICTWCSLPLPDDLNQIGTRLATIYPVSRGGETSPENYGRATRRACNMAKGARVAA